MRYELEKFGRQVSALIGVEPSDVLPYDLREKHVAQSVHLSLTSRLPTPSLLSQQVGAIIDYIYHVFIINGSMYKSLNRVQWSSIDH